MAEKEKRYKKLEEFLLKDVQKTGKRLGSGTFGNVEELTVGGTVCVGKRFHMALLDIDKGDMPVPAVIERFVSGCKLMSKLHHPNIIQFMGLCLFDEVPYPILVMEAVYDDFHTILIKRSSNLELPFPLILHILLDVTKGLVYLHTQQSPIIHRNLTAHNVLVDKASMKSKLADVGSSLLIDSTKLSLVRHTPGIVPYMPPEAFDTSFIDNIKFDMFSFGHLTLFAILQEFPRDLLPSTYPDPLTDEPKMRNEVERRESYIRRMFVKLTRSHAMTKMVVQCLHNSPEKRPAGRDALDMINSVLKEESDDQLDMKELMNVAEGSPDLSSTYADRTIALKPGIQSQSHEIPGLLEILRTYTVYGVLKRHGWRQHIFQIKNGYLKFFSGTKMEKVVDELDLTSVVHIATRVPDDDDKTKFYFEVHFSKGTGSPWILRTYTQEDQIKWMEAIKPGSASSVRISHYETVSLRVDEGAYSYVSIPRSPVMRNAASDDVYDEPHSYSHQLRFLSDSVIPEVKSVESSGDAFTQHNDAKLSDSSPSNKTNVAKSSNIDHVLQNVNDSLKEKAHSLVDTEMEGKNDQYQFQLKILDQMQRLVQKLEDVSDVVRVPDVSKSSLQTEPDEPCDAPEKHDTDDPSHGSELSSLPQTSSQHFPSGKVNDSDKTQISQGKTLYENVDCDGHKISSNPSPTSKNGKNSESETQVYIDSTDVEPQQRSRAKLMIRGEYRSPVVRQKQHVLKLLQKEKRSDNSEMDMIRTIRARSSTISSGILSHLPSDDDKADRTKVVSPQWTRASMKTRIIEPSLDELQTEAIFIPNSALTSLTEIGEGQYGKVFKGLYKKSSTEIEVAIKTVKICDSDKEKENFFEEMNVMSSLLHPNIVRFFGLTKQDEPRIVLEYLPHGDLKSFLNQNDRPVEELVKYLLDVATGMHYISEKGLVHRDLAARNIMVSKDEICKIGDFGLLRELPKDENVYVASNKVALPFRWMAPESLPPKRQFSTASDVWSFGIVMWEVHNPSKIPYAEMDNMECAIRVVKEGLKVPIPETFPPTAKRIMKACLLADPTRRPSFLLIASLLTNTYYGTE